MGQVCSKFWCPTDTSTPLGPVLQKMNSSPIDGAVDHKEMKAYGQRESDKNHWHEALRQGVVTTGDALRVGSRLSNYGQHEMSIQESETRAELELKKAQKEKVEKGLTNAVDKMSHIVKQQIDSNEKGDEERFDLFPKYSLF
ncbi:hypothetical protein B9Z55_012349 [Caenorhabditis nigoni]|uniref:Uncharacterized protein n=1 Tax=Caenorhabditis nigoni TaxID=1611254 RepID=A0A2G5TWT2_9PELO|nr:hypothetical protein B9Z55_012349 [Caenorhabditis nigoni]